MVFWRDPNLGSRRDQTGAVAELYLSLYLSLVDAIKQA
jgi:hypothetical protein